MSILWAYKTLNPVCLGFWVMRHHGIRSELVGYKSYLPSTGSAKWVHVVYGNSYYRLKSGCWHTHGLGVCEMPLSSDVITAHWLCAVFKQARYLIHFWWEGNLMGLWKVALILLLFDFRCPTRPRNSKIPLVHPLGTWHGHFRFGPIWACVESNIWLKNSAKLAQIATSP